MNQNITLGPKGFVVLLVVFSIFVLKFMHGALWLLLVVVVYL